jgi:hypothetical protein
VHVGQRTANNLEEYCSVPAKIVICRHMYFFFALLDVRNLWNGEY